MTDQHFAESASFLRLHIVSIQFTPLPALFWNDVEIVHSYVETIRTGLSTGLIRSLHRPEMGSILHMSKGTSVRMCCKVHELLMHCSIILGILVTQRMLLPNVEYFLPNLDN